VRCFGVTSSGITFVPNYINIRRLETCASHDQHLEKIDSRSVHTGIVRMFAGRLGGRKYVYKITLFKTVLLIASQFSGYKDIPLILIFAKNLSGYS
jgi:hypothetical protein